VQLPAGGGGAQRAIARSCEPVQCIPGGAGLDADFFASPLDQRQNMAQQAQSLPGTQQYVGLVVQIADTCNNY
jgi:hypothetical protein